MKKRLILTAMAVIMTMTVAIAQQIAVVSEGGGTNVYQTFPQAIEGASDGSVIYLPGGGFPLPDSVKITKKLTIIGIGYKATSGNVDGSTSISGNLWFNQGSSGSAVIGCYLSGSVNIGEDGTVSNIAIKYCNVYSIDVKNANCYGMVINQNFVRDFCRMNNSDGSISNSVLGVVNGLNGGYIKNCMITGSPQSGGSYGSPVQYISNSIINNNIITSPYGEGFAYCADCQVFNNYGPWGLNTGVNPIIIDGDPNNILYGSMVFHGVPSPYNNYHFTDEYAQYDGIVGIYAGTGFNDDALPPVPYIVAKRIAEQTDAAGQLKIQVRVKAGE